MQFEELLGPVRVVPVITVPELDAAVPLARALVAGGLPVLEVTLRTDAGLEAIRLIRDQVPEAIVGAGTVTNPEQLADASACGAQFIVSPGCTEALISAAGETVLLPGAVTASEVMRILDHGITTMKFFPAQASGGVAALKALAGPFPQVKFCPTGGISLDSSASYLERDNVVCVGGSWMVANDLIANRSWDRIRKLAAQTAERTSARSASPRDPGRARDRSPYAQPR